MIHRSATSVAALGGPRARHGAAAGSLHRRHPGAMPRRSPLGATGRQLAAEARAGRRNIASLALVDVLLEWEFAAGRLLPNAPSARRGER